MGDTRRLRQNFVVLAPYLGVGFLVGVAILLAGSGVLLGTALAISGHLPSVEALYTPPSEATRIYAANGDLIASLYQENRANIPLSQIPRTFQRAVIDTEDAGFYRHHGISLRGVLRASFRNVRERGLAEGGSTITQQLARNLFLTNEKALSRKIAEMLLAVQIERRLTKDEILERYLNQVYFGQGAYGVEAASEVYFGKPAQDLTLPESALLAGLIRAPSYDSPYDRPDRAMARRAEVLQRMVELGDITPVQMRAAQLAPIQLVEKGNAGFIGIRAPWFVSYILPPLLQRYGEDVLYKGGLRIYTTLDLAWQAQAEAVLKAGIDRADHDKLNVHQGAMIVLDPQTGAIRAMIGGYDYRASQFNRAWQARRQPGSAFKPFTYATALLRGIPFTTMLQDAPISYTLTDGTTWEPKNFDNKWYGWVTMRFALENSLNAATIRLEERVDPENIVALAHRLGIESALQPTPSLTLGSSDVTLLEMASAYGVFASGGVRAAPMAILKVTDSKGNVLQDNVPQRTVVLSPEVAYMMADLLKGNVRRGTGAAANLGIPQGGKTGTTDDYRNAWFIGFTPTIVTGVWVGNDDNSAMKKVTGGGLPAQIWAAFMKPVTDTMPKTDWPRPAGVVEAVTCATTGLLAAPDCPDPHPELFIKGTEPTTYDQSHGTSSPSGAAGPSAASAAGQMAAGQATAVASSPSSSLPLTVTSPRTGSQVSAPFLVKGATRPGAAVHVAVQVKAGFLNVRVADADAPVDASGNFAYLVNPTVKPAGATLTIVVSAAAGQDTASTAVSVQEQ